MGLERRFRGSNQAALSLLPPNSYLAAMSYAELEAGVWRAETDVQVRHARQFLSDILQVVDFVPFGFEEAVSYARIHDYLRRVGQLIGERDMQIAATGLARGHSVMTGNRREFERVPGLTILDPPNI